MIIVDLWRRDAVTLRYRFCPDLRDFPSPDARPHKERERLLKDFAERFLAEGALHGFDADELLTHLKRRLSKGE